MHRKTSCHNQIKFMTEDYYKYTKHYNCLQAYLQDVQTHNINTVIKNAKITLAQMK